MIKALEYDKDNHVRENAAKALGKIGDARAVEPLIIALSDGNYRYGAAEALGKIGDDRAVKPLIKALNDPNKYIRMEAAGALGKMNDARAVGPLLIKSLNDSDEEVRREAAEAYGKVGTSPVEPLVKVFNDSDKDVRKRAAEALEIIGWKPGKDEIAAQYWIAKQEWNKCVEIGTPAVESLIKVLSDSHEYVRREAAEALGKIGDPRAVEPLVKALNGPNDFVRRDAAEALEIIGWKPGKDEIAAQYWLVKKQYDKCVEIGASAVGPLISALSEYYSDVHEKARVIIALGKTGDDRAVEPLIKALSDPGGDGWFISQAAADALGELRNAGGVKPLIRALDDSHEEVRREAASSLVKLYKSNNVDQESKNAILHKRNYIEMSHGDSSYSSDCRHLDYAAINFDSFPENT